MKLSKLDEFEVEIFENQKSIPTDDVIVLGWYQKDVMLKE